MQEEETNSLRCEDKSSVERYFNEACDCANHYITAWNLESSLCSTIT